MNLLKNTWKYFFDKGIQLVLLSIVPALLTPFLISPSTSLNFLFQYKTVDASSFSAMYSQMRSLPFEYFYLGILGIILYIFVLSLMFGIVDRHMRVGEFTISFRRAKTRLNYNLLTAVKFMLVVAICFEATNMLTTVLFYLWAVVFGPGTTWLVFSIVSCLLGVFLMALMSTSILLWPPFMLHTGLKSADAFSMGWRQMAGKNMSAVFTLFTAVAPFQLLMIIFGAIGLGPIAELVLDGITFAVILPFYVILMYNVFYEVTGTERMDLQKFDIWSKKSKKAKH